MIDHSFARDGPTRWKVDLTSTARVLATSRLAGERLDIDLSEKPACC